MNLYLTVSGGTELALNYNLRAKGFDLSSHDLGVAMP